MAEQDPRKYRGGVEEDDSQGIVPREMVDEPTEDTSPDAQQLGDPVQGAVTDKDPHDSAIDTEGGNEADATQGQTGATVDDPSDIAKDDPVSKWDAANAAPANTGDGST